MRGRTWAAVAVVATGCGPRVDEPEVQLRTCGRDGAVPLLEFDAAVPMNVQRFGDELLVLVVDEDRQEQPAGENPPGEHTQRWLVGECGEGARRVAEDLVVEPVGDWLLACRQPRRDHETGDLLAIDPSGETPPRMLLEGTSKDA